MQSGRIIISAITKDHGKHHSVLRYLLVSSVKLYYKQTADHYEMTKDELFHGVYPPRMIFQDG